MKGLSLQNRISTSGQAQLTPEAVERYLSSLRQKGLIPATLERYERALRHLQEYLGEESVIGPDTLAHWQAALKEAGYSTSTVNHHISVANNLLTFLDRKDLTTDRMQPEQTSTPVLSRAEYHRLLLTARREQKSRTYLLVKLFGTMDIYVQELKELTVEAARNGYVTVLRSRQPRVIFIPYSLQQELLEYASRKEIHTGPVFLSRSGEPLADSTVTLDIQNLGADAGISKEKASARALRKMYLSAMEDIRRDLEVKIVQTYDRMIEAEQKAVGWNGI